MLAAFTLFNCMFMPAKPMTMAQPVPSLGVLTAPSKEQRLELWGSGFILHRESPLAKRVALAQEWIAKKRHKDAM